MTDTQESPKGEVSPGDDSSARDDIDRVGEKTLVADGKQGPFGRLALFLRQIVAELRKVVRPTRQELLSYTVTVLVFVLAIMAFVSIIDFGLAKAIFWVFGGKSTP